jgi:hypothetical protein
MLKSLFYTIIVPLYMIKPIYRFQHGSLFVWRNSPLFIVRIAATNKRDPSYKSDPEIKAIVDMAIEEYKLRKRKSLKA